MNQDMLALENQRRAAKGLEPYESFEAYEKSESEDVEPVGGPVEITLEDDPVLNEAGYIMADFIGLKKHASSPQVANFD